MSARRFRAVGVWGVSLALLWIASAGCPPWNLDAGLNTNSDANSQIDPNAATPDGSGTDGASDTPIPDPNGSTDPGPPPDAEPNSATAPPCAGTLSGVVRMETTFEIVAGATVTCGGVSATTGAAGLFTLGHVPCGPQQLLVEAAYFQPLTANITVADEDGNAAPLTLRSLYGHRDLEGTVRDVIGHRVADVRVTIGPCSDVSDANGVYSLCDIPVGEHEISAAHELFDAFQAPVAVPPPGTPVADFDIIMLGTTLPAPTGLASAGGWRQVALHWDAVTDPPADHYRVFVAAGGDGPSGARALVGETSAPSLVHMGLEPDAVLQYSVSAVFAAGAEGPRCAPVPAITDNAVVSLAELGTNHSGLNYAAGRLWCLRLWPSGELRVCAVDPSDPNAIQERPAWSFSAPSLSLAALAVTDDPDVIFSNTGPGCPSLCRRTWTGAAYTDCEPVTGLPDGCIEAMDWRDGRLFVLQVWNGDTVIREGTVSAAGEWTTVRNVPFNPNNGVYGLAIADADTAWVISDCGYWTQTQTHSPCCASVGMPGPHPEFITGMPICSALLQVNLTNGVVQREIPITLAGEPRYAPFTATDGVALYLASRSDPAGISRVRTDP